MGSEAKMLPLKYLITTCVLALTIGTANAIVINSEDFNDPGFQGSFRCCLSPPTSSDKYALTNYYNINNVENWTFAGDVQYALNGSRTDGAVLLNEGYGSVPGGSASTTVAGLNPGTTYTLSFDVWGDNIPGQAWVLNVSVDGAFLLGLTAVDQQPGTNLGTTAMVSFTATGTSAVLGFSQASTTSASPIFDNVQVSTTPLPAALPLFASGLGGMGLFGWWRKRKDKRKNAAAVAAA
jgi:hypothetical protein